MTISSVANSDPDPDYRKDPAGHGTDRDIRTERWYHTILQVSVPFFIAGIGTIGAGFVLNEVKVTILFEKKENREEKSPNRLKVVHFFLDCPLIDKVFVIV